MLFDEFDQPTILFYGLVLGVIGILFVVISSFFFEKEETQLPDNTQNLCTRRALFR